LRPLFRRIVNVDINGVTVPRGRARLRDDGQSTGRPPRPIRGCGQRFAPEVAGVLATAAWGWHIDAAIHPVGDYLRENPYYRFSGFNWTPAFLDLLLQVGADRILFSTDSPYGSMTQARTFLDLLPASAADKERIAHGDAERLLRLDARRPRASLAAASPNTGEMVRR